MKMGKMKIYALEFLICVIFFFTLFISSTYLRIIIASILLICLLGVKKFFHKKNIVSLYYKQAIVMLGLLSVVFLLIFYVLGLYFGYAKTTIPFSLLSLFKIILPTAVIVIISEAIRSILLLEKSMISKVLTTMIMIFIDLTLYMSVSQMTNFESLRNIISFSLLSSIANNLLWNYTSVRFGSGPAIIFKLVMTLYEFIIPVVPNVFLYFRCFLRIVYPYIIYLILEMSYSKNKFVVALKDKKRDNIVAVILLVVMISIIMLISCEFKYGLLVIGTGSMSDAIDIGDAVIYESYDAQKIKEQQVIIFQRENIKVVHRVVDIKEVNGVKRYYTKGDANKNNDSGYRTHEDIVGLVKFKIKYIGQPTLMLRDIFN